ncbi:MAG: hypothetical protein DME18_09425 [Verrucomicrobia bacterium]|nr:MAG: hypothetical protein DME19_02835 [Verrucomicrobiota bacterium]PYM13272.1 MAG: hypothetical protein DME18_09425 [Verrucomicrobiota bacterium]
MNRVERYLAFGLAGISLAIAAQADVTEPAGNPYQVIIDRNPFGLKPPPLITNIIPTNPVIPVNLKLTGITSDRIGRKAWLMIPGQPGKNPNPQYLSIPEHEKQGDIEVLEINEKENTVKILNAGAPAELNFKDNGLPTPSALAVPGGPLTPHGMPGPLPAPGVVPAPGTPMPALKTAGAFPTGAAAPDAMAARYGLQPTTPANTGLRTIPARNVRTTAIEPQVQGTEAPVDPAVQRVLIEAHRLQAEREGRAFPPIPPVPGIPGK